MPRLSEAAYAQHYDSVITMAKRKGGVSRPEIMELLAVSRVMADSLIDRCKLRKSKRKVGRTEFFHTSRGTKGVLAAVNTNESGADGTSNKPDNKPAEKTSTAQKNGGAPKAKKAKAAKPATTSQPSEPIESDAPSSPAEIEQGIKEMADRAARGLADSIIFRARAEAAGDALRQKLAASN